MQRRYVSTVIPFIRFLCPLLTVYASTVVYVCAPCEKETGRRTVSKYQLSTNPCALDPLFFCFPFVFVAYTYLALIPFLLVLLCVLLQRRLSFSTVLYNVGRPHISALSRLVRSEPDVARRPEPRRHALPYRLSRVTATRYDMCQYLLIVPLYVPVEAIVISRRLVSVF